MSTATPTQEIQRMTRERVYQPSEFERVMLMVHEERFRGQIILDCAGGGVCSIRVCETQKVTPP